MLYVIHSPGPVVCMLRDTVYQALYIKTKPGRYGIINKSDVKERGIPDTAIAQKSQTTLIYNGPEYIKIVYGGRQEKRTKEKKETGKEY